ncbi:MAG: hypothetical protein ACHQRJ_02290 [Alphaproteobacteria bacterium]
MLAAPVLGFALESVLANILYLCDVPAWDLAARDDEASHCRRLAVDVENPFLERYVELYLTDLAALWWSERPLNDYFGVGADLGLQPRQGAPDCLVTDRPLAPALATAAPGERVISLAR